MHTPPRIASLIAQLSAGQPAVRLLPAGKFRSADGSGRPHDAPAWRMDAETAAILISQDAARANRRVVDYEHQTLSAASNGQPAPAAGWIEALEWRDDGLYAGIAWTPKAAAMIDDGEYRYLSPVFSYDATGRVLDILHAGITNHPGLDGLTDLAALTAYLSTQPPKEQPLMKDLLKALGLSDAASEADALTAVAALKAATVAAMTAKPATPPDPALYAPAETVVALQAKVAELHAAMTASTLEDMVQSGMADGRILPDLEAWARTLNVAALKGFLEKAKPIAALSGLQTAGIKPTATTAATADVETAMRIGGWDAAVFTPKKD